MTDRAVRQDCEFFSNEPCFTVLDKLYMQSHISIAILGLVLGALEVSVVAYALVGLLGWCWDFVYKDGASPAFSYGN